MARRGVVGAASQNRHDSNHEETGKGDPFWGPYPAVAGPAKSWWFRSNIMVVLNRFMVWMPIPGADGEWGFCRKVKKGDIPYASAAEFANVVEIGCPGGPLGLFVGGPPAGAVPGIP